MKVYSYSELAYEPIKPLKCDKYPKVTVPDLNVDLYEMLVRHQNGDISTLGGTIRHDAHYDSAEDIETMRVNLANDPDFNIATAKYYIKAIKDKAEQLAYKDIAEYQRKQAEVVSVSEQNVSED